MALFQNKKVKQLQTQVKALVDGYNRNITASINASLQQQFSTNYYPDLDTSKAVDKYATSDQLYSIVNKISEASALIPIYPYIKTQDKALKKLKGLTKREFYSKKGIFDIRLMQMKALEDVPENNELLLLLENPNQYQSKTEFLNAAYIYYLTTGECFIYKDRITEGANGGRINSLNILPPANISLRITNTFPLQITGYDFLIDGRAVLENIPPEDIIHWKRFNPYYSVNGNHLRGLSPLKAGTMPIERLKEADIRGFNQLKNGAVPGIVSNESFEGDDSEVTAFDNQKKAFYNFTTNPANHGSPFFVGGKLNYTQIGLSAADLQLIELQNIDFKRLCNIYKISTILFNSDVASTESNVQEQIKQMYTSACLPMVFSLTSKLNNSLAIDYGVEYYLDADISEITELQEDINQMVNAIAAMPITITGNEMRALLNYDERDEEWMDTPLIKQGYDFYQDTQIEPVDPNLLNIQPNDNLNQQP